MTAPQKTALHYLLMCVGAIATVFFSLGIARVQLDSKEDRASHDRDMAAIQQSVQRILDVVCEGKAVSPRACK